MLVHVDTSGVKKFVLYLSTVTFYYTQHPNSILSTIMPGNNIHLRYFMETVTPFLRGETNSVAISLFVRQLNRETMCHTFLDGNTMLSKLLEMSSVSRVEQSNYLISLLIAQAALLGRAYDSSTISYLMTHKNNLGNNLLNHSSYYASNQSFRLLLDTLMLLVTKDLISSGACRELIMSSNTEGYNSLGWLLTLGNEDKLSIYLAAIHSLIDIRSLSASDYRSLLQSQQTIPYDSYVFHSKLDAPKRQLSKPFIFTTFMLALMSSNKKVTQIYINELAISLSRELLNLTETISLLRVTSEDGYRVLDRLSLYGTAENFDLCLMIFTQAFERRVISQEDYFDLILKHTRPGHSLLHQLIMNCNIEKLKSYTAVITALMNKGLISEHYYLDVFLVRNLHGYPAFHQAVNSFSRDISLFVIDLLKSNLSEVNYMQALTVKAESTKHSSLKSIAKPHSAEINRLIAAELRAVKLKIESIEDEPERVPSPHYFRFFTWRVCTHDNSFEPEIQAHANSNL